VSELYRPSDRRLSAKLVPNFADGWCHVVSVTDPYDPILGFLDRSRYFFFQVALNCTHQAEWTSLFNLLFCHFTILLFCTILRHPVPLCRSGFLVYFLLLREALVVGLILHNFIVKMPCMFRPNCLLTIGQLSFNTYITYESRGAQTQKRLSWRFAATTGNYRPDLSLESCRKITKEEELVTDPKLMPGTETD
jgi:hypothetical protein